MKSVIVVSLMALLLASCERKSKEESSNLYSQPSPQQQEQQAQVPANVNAEALAKAKGCFACHDINAKKVGPAFKDVAKREAGKVDEVAKAIKNGGVGEWGNVPMPPQSVTEEEARLLAQWVLSLR